MLLTGPSCRSLVIERSSMRWTESIFTFETTVFCTGLNSILWFFGSLVAKCGIRKLQCKLVPKIRNGLAFFMSSSGSPFRIFGMPSHQTKQWVCLLDSLSDTLFWQILYIYPEAFAVEKNNVYASIVGFIIGLYIWLRMTKFRAGVWCQCTIFTPWWGGGC